MELLRNECITSAGLRVSMPFPGIIRVTDGNHTKDSYMVSAKLRKAVPKVQGERLVWGKVAIEPENNMALYYDGKLLCQDYTAPRNPLIQVSDEELELLKSEGHAIENMLMKEWPVEVVKTLRPESAIYGLGDKTGYLDKRHYCYENWCTDDPAPQVDCFKALYKSINFFIVTGENGCYGILADNTFRTHFDFGKESGDYLWFAHAGGALDYYMIPGSDIKEVLRKYIALTGASKMQQKWVYGYHQSHWGYLSAEEIREISDTMRACHVPFDAIHWDIDYMEGFRVFTFNGQRFADPKGLCDYLKSINVKPITIIDPGVKKDEGYFMYDEGEANGYFAKNPDGSTYVGRVWPGEAVFPDFSQEEVRAWWGEKAKILTDMGIRGIWNDMNEPANFTGQLPDDVQFEGGNHLEMHNVYGHLMAQATYDGLLKADGKRPFVLTRACCAGSQRYCSGWTGDNHSMWAHIQLSLVQMMNLGLSGMANVGSDVGGFGSDCTPELLARWTQAGCLSPFFRNHYAQGTRRQEPWAFGEETLNAVRKAIQLRYHLLPYIYDLAHEDLPMLRPLILEYPEDGNCRNICDQFMLGDKLMAAPVITAGTTARAVYLPKGIWYDYYTGKRYVGGRHILAEAPMDHLPLFAKAGAIIPVAVGNPECVEDIREVKLEIFPGNGVFVHYTDDGETMDYEKGALHALKINVRGHEVKQTVLKNGYEAPSELTVEFRV